MSFNLGDVFSGLGSNLSSLFSTITGGAFDGDLGGSYHGILNDTGKSGWSSNLLDFQPATIDTAMGNFNGIGGNELYSSSLIKPLELSESSIISSKGPTTSGLGASSLLDLGKAYFAYKGFKNAEKEQKFKQHAYTTSFNNAVKEANADKRRQVMLDNKLHEGRPGFTPRDVPENEYSYL